MVFTVRHVWQSLDSGLTPCFHSSKYATCKTRPTASQVASEAVYTMGHLVNNLLDFCRDMLAIKHRTVWTYVQHYRTLVTNVVQCSSMHLFPWCSRHLLNNINVVQQMSHRVDGVSVWPLLLPDHSHWNKLHNGRDLFKRGIRNQSASIRTSLWDLIDAQNKKQQGHQNSFCFYRSRELI